MIAQLAPGYYVREEGAIAHLGGLLRTHGYHKALIVSGSRSYRAAQAALEGTLREHHLVWTVCRYRGECSDEDARRIVEGAGTNWDMVVGVGGGKVLDLSKLVAALLNIPLTTVPTLISNCAATTPNVVVYHPDGRAKESRVSMVPPQWTLVDDRILQHSPAPYFASGLGDTIVKPYEALVGATSGTLLENAALSTARLAADCVRADGAAAVRALAQGASHPALGALTDAVILAGSLVGGVGGAVLRGAVAHALHDALTTLPEAHATLHGEKVAYGLVVQEVLLERPADDVRTLRGVLSGLALPVSWQTLTGSPTLPSPSVLETLADRTLQSPLLMDRLPGVGIEQLVGAIRRTESL